MTTSVSAGISLTRAWITLTGNPASFTRFFSWLAPMRLEPIPASHTNTTSRTSAAALSAMDRSLRVGREPPDAPGVCVGRPHGGWSSGGGAGRNGRCGSGLGLLLGGLHRVEAKDGGSDDERGNGAGRHAEEDAQMLARRGHGEVGEDAARGRRGHEARVE